MASDADWAKGYARQSQADFATWQALEKIPETPICHRMLFLQMTCEKICKAMLIRYDQLPSATLQSSHGYIAKHLPTLIRRQLEVTRAPAKLAKEVVRFSRQLAGEVEIMNPSMDRGGQRPDNCEYPWAIGEVLYSPLNWTFTPDGLLRQRFGNSFIKTLKNAIDQVVSDLS